MCIHLDKEPSNELLRPCVDVLFNSVARTFKENAIGVVLSGMGYDGTIGCKALKAAGAKTIVQDEETSVVYGMPKSVSDAGVADVVIGINQISHQIEMMF